MKTPPTRLTIIPGHIRFADATRADYAAIARHHYRSTPPATFCRIRGAWHRDTHGRERLIAIAVLSWPVPMVPARRRHFGRLFALSIGYRAALLFANANVRTISRVIVHPQFRSIGLARRLVRELVARCPTRYAETLATMGDFVGCFTAAGMTRVPTLSGEAAYFVIDREGRAARGRRRAKAATSPGSSASFSCSSVAPCPSSLLPPSPLPLSKEIP
jgi:GNAT superfamily N-acetyltransferase